MRYHEAHVERMLGRQVRDADGHEIGRLEDLRADIVDGEWVVVEFHLGSGAFVERIAGFIRQLPFFRPLPRTGSVLRVPWQLFDLSDPNDLRIRVRLRELPGRHDEAA